jgi:hypothetical protein
MWHAHYHLVLSSRASRKGWIISATRYGRGTFHGDEVIRFVRRRCKPGDKFKTQSTEITTVLFKTCDKLPQVLPLQLKKCHDYTHLSSQSSVFPPVRKKQTYLRESKKTVILVYFKSNLGSTKKDGRSKYDEPTHIRTYLTDSEQRCLMWHVLTWSEKRRSTSRVLRQKDVKLVTFLL